MPFHLLVTIVIIPLGWYLALVLVVSLYQVISYNKVHNHEVQGSELYPIMVAKLDCITTL